MATFALVHGGGGSAWDWASGATELRERGHDPVAVDLPCEDPSAGWWNYADTVAEAIDERRELVVVGHSLGGLTAPLVCARMPVDLLVLVAAMIPSPGELFDDWWVSTGYEASGYDDVFYHDVPPDLAAEAGRRERGEAAGALREPWPLEAWPETPTRYLLCRDDRMFPAAWRDAMRASAWASRSAGRGSWPTGSRRMQRKLGEPRQFPRGTAITAR